MSESRKRGLLGRLRTKRQERKQRAAERAHREQQGGTMRGDKRQDGFKEKVPSPSDQWGGFGS